MPRPQNYRTLSNAATPARCAPCTAARRRMRHVGAPEKAGGYLPPRAMVEPQRQHLQEQHYSLTWIHSGTVAGIAVDERPATARDGAQAKIGRKRSHHTFLGGRMRRRERAG